MGKNPNAKKLKEKKHKERTYDKDIDDLEEEAARKGVNIYELEEVKQDLGSGSDEDSGSDNEKKANQKLEKKKQQESSDDEEEKEEVK